MMKRLRSRCCFAVAGITLAAADDGAEREARWKSIAGDIFGERPIEDGSALLKLKVPEQAMDAALVPISVDFIGDRPITSVSVVVDNNPMPLAGRFRLGPAFARQDLKLRIRVNEFTLIHAVAETGDGEALRGRRNISGPPAAAPRRAPPRQPTCWLGWARCSCDANARSTPRWCHRVSSSAIRTTAGCSRTRAATTPPARYLERVSVSVGGVSVFDMDGGISLSEDPSIGFTYVAGGNAEVDVRVQDSSSAQFAQHFDAL